MQDTWSDAVADVTIPRPDPSASNPRRFTRGSSSSSWTSASASYTTSQLPSPSLAPSQMVFSINLGTWTIGTVKPFVEISKQGLDGIEIQSLVVWLWLDFDLSRTQVINDKQVGKKLKHIWTHTCDCSFIHPWKKFEAYRVFFYTGPPLKSKSMENLG